MKIIRKLQIVMIVTGIVGIVILFTSCALNKTSPYSPSQMAEVIISAQTAAPVLRPLLREDSYFADYLSNVYRIEADVLEDGIIYYTYGMEASELAVLLLIDGPDPKEIKNALLQYIERRTKAFAGYAPKQAAILENSIVAVQGPYVALLICEEPQKAESVFLSCFSNNPPKLPAETESLFKEEEALFAAIERVGDDSKDGYDPAAILAAWRSGDKSVLTDKNRKILEACVEVIETLIKDNMTDYEKELAIHDWIVRWTGYDEDAMSNAPDARPAPDSENPYGLLFNQKAVCEGYTSTFQLFMDLLGVECITVKGTSDEGAAAHFWNMVRLDGEWYCVDVTWDDPIGIIWQGAFVRHKYFNVTSEFLRENDHQWDESLVPEATAAAAAYGNGR